MYFIDKPEIRKYNADVTEKFTFQSELGKIYRLNPKTISTNFLDTNSISKEKLQTIYYALRKLPILPSTQLLY